MKIEIDENSGFCFGVVTAINKAEAELAIQRELYCLGDIVHNSMEVERLSQKGLITINREEFLKLRRKRSYASSKSAVSISSYGYFPSYPALKRAGDSECAIG